MKCKYMCHVCENPCVLKSNYGTGKYHPLVCPYGDVTIKAKWERVEE